jgi:N-acetyl-D-muramate 6-phosphate phosphatase
MPEADSRRRRRGGGVLFDLDGTFADTAPDMARALNRLLAAHGRAPLPFERVRPHVSHGGRAMVRIGFGLAPEDAGYDTLRRQFLDLYAEDLARDTAPFPGVPELVTELDGRGIPWGIVTNKPAWLTDPLMAAIGYGQRAACVVSGDTATRPKPHPDPVLHACALIDREPGDCWFVGDAERDVAAGRAAGCGTLVALFGYLDDGEDPTAWGADGAIDTPLDLLPWLNP